MHSHDRTASAALAALFILQATMLSALFAGVPPHPPASTPLFGMAPFVAASLSVALAAILAGPVSSSVGRILAGLAAAFALVSFGPQKYVDAQIALIWPAVLVGQLAVATIAVQLARSKRRFGVRA